MFDFLFRRTRRRRATWTAVAGELGGAFHLPTGFFRRKNERIEATVDGVPVVLDWYLVSTGKSAQSYTRVTASYVRGPGPTLKIYRQGVLASIGKAIGTQDIDLGVVPAFDTEFMVKADSVAVTRRLLSRAAMERILASFGRARIDGGVESIKLVETGIWEDADRLRGGIALLADLAGRDLFGAEALRAIPDASFVQAPGERPRAELDAPVRVVVQAEEQGDHLAMVARAAAEPTTLEPIDLAIVDGRVADAQRAGQLPQGAHVPLRSVGSGVLAVDATGLRFTWRDLELDPARLRAGAELLGAVAAGTGGVYR